MLVQPLSGYGSIGEAIAAAVVDLQYERDPSLEGRYGKTGRSKCIQDSRFHVGYLLEAADQDRPDVFLSYAAWVKAVLGRFGVGHPDLADHFAIMREVVADRLAGDQRTCALAALDAAIRQLPHMPDEPQSYLRDDNPLAGLARDYLAALINRQRDQAMTLIKGAISDTVTVRDIYIHVFQPVQREVGRLWQLGEISVAQEHYGSAVTQLVMSQLYSYIFSGERVGKTFVAACVGDELHELGMRMVADFMEMEGWDTVYLGANMPMEEIVGAVVENKADALGLSATLPFHVGRVRDIVTAVRADPSARDVLVIVGGYAFGEGGGDWRITGANAYAADAAGAVRTLKMDGS
ncbi:B12-binding domain-containing protein [Magnetospira sp. QH-2]|uniref:cobalamin B12-binding domain-containing protein n=1 Tax=Magnetospira sp. (strain QH-2) TaxID=1288970 RepID=UPI0003E810A4|nr:cobalamin-dependent protein [Magnetospira sp. QH-2]CCQ74734.1 conserved protein of unknown function[Include cobalamin B12-binding domain] [Magnetospira sp. QH-2]